MSDDNSVQASRVEIRSGSTIYDWLSGSHPGFKKFLIFLFALAVLYISWRISWIIPVFAILAFILGYVSLHNAFFADDCVRVVSAYDDDCSTLDVLLIGKDRFRKMTKSGTASPLSTSSGDPIFISEDTTKDAIKFSWCHEFSRFNFMLRRDAFDRAQKLAEDTASSYYAIKNIPRVLALQESGLFIAEYERYYDSILRGDSVDEIKTKVSEDLQKGVDLSTSGDDFNVL